MIISRTMIDSQFDVTVKGTRPGKRRLGVLVLYQYLYLYLVLKKLATFSQFLFQAEQTTHQESLVN